MIARVASLRWMLLRPFLYDETACASYLFGCLSMSQLAVVDPHVELVEAYRATAASAGAPIVAVLETHVQADHVSGLPDLVEMTGATAHVPAGAEVEFACTELEDDDVLELGNTPRACDRDARSRAGSQRLPRVGRATQRGSVARIHR